MDESRTTKSNRLLSYFKFFEITKNKNEEDFRTEIKRKSLF